MTDFDRDNIIAGIYRNLEDANPAEALRILRQIAEILVRIGGGLERAGIIPRQNAAPVQSALALDLGLPAPGTIMRAAPRVWNNSVKVYDVLWDCYRTKGFTGGELVRNADALRLIMDATHARVDIPTILRVLSALPKAGAATRKGGVYTLREPTDALREAVEQARRGRKGA